MKLLFVIAALSALAVSAPASARPGNGHGHGWGSPGAELDRGVGYGVGGCPPGLAKKAVPCMPPGQARKLFGIGQRVPLGYRLLRYNALPYRVRRYYGPRLDPYSRYIYSGGYVYRVNPRTLIVQQILSALARPY
jgi:hypothetical protein